MPLYILSQVLGAMFGTLIAWGNYMHAIKLVDPHKTRLTASFFAIYAQDYLPSGRSFTCGLTLKEGSSNTSFVAACFFSEFLGAALLVLVIFAVLDRNNGPPPPGLVPLVLFILFIGLGACLGMNTAFGVNPVSTPHLISHQLNTEDCHVIFLYPQNGQKARDFGPRIALSMLGYSRSVVWNYRSQFWIWTGIIAPICGALSGGALYDAFLYTGDDSIFSST